MATAIFEGTGQQVAVPDYLANTHIAGNSTKIKYKLIDFGLYFLLIIIVNALTNVGLAMESVLLMTLGSVVGFLLFALAIIQLVLMLTRGQTIAFILVGARTVNFTTGQKAGGGMFLKSLLESVIGFVSFGIAPIIMWFVSQDEHGRTWFDRTCNTIVIDIKKGRDTGMELAVPQSMPQPPMQ